jgi:hypothetical protein
MIKAESDQVLVKASAPVLFQYLGNFNNFGKLMPPQVTNWQSTEHECSFTIQGMADIELYTIEKVAPSMIHIGARGKTPIPLEMKWNFSGVSELETNAVLSLQADINPVMAMMAKAPLQNFVNMLAQKLKDLADSGLIS